MRSTLFFVLVLFLAGALLPATAQQRSRRPAAPARGAGKDSLKAKAVTLGSRPLPVLLTKRSFDSVTRLRLTPVEPGARVTGFQFIYGEHRMYEDEGGNPFWTTDYLREFCTGDSINATLREFLGGHSKAGDTAWFEQIAVQRPNGGSYYAPPLTFGIRP